jgi:hypothetical protein
MSKYQIGMFLNNKMIHGNGNTYEEALMDMVDNSIEVHGNWYPQKKWWQFWKKKYPSWVLDAFTDWEAHALNCVIQNICPEETPFYDSCKTKTNNNLYQWELNNLSKEKK